jgi:hypothetical protein
MVRQLAPSHLKTAGPTSAPPQRYVHADTVVVNHYTGANKLIPTVPGFRTSAGKLNFSLVDFSASILAFLRILGSNGLKGRTFNGPVDPGRNGLITHTTFFPHTFQKKQTFSERVN